MPTGRHRPYKERNYITPVGQKHRHAPPIIGLVEHLGGRKILETEIERRLVEAGIRLEGTRRIICGSFPVTLSGGRSWSEGSLA